MSEDTRFSMPAIFDLPVNHPSRRSYDARLADLHSKMDRVERLLFTILKQGTPSVGETVDEIDAVINHMASHSAVQADGTLASLTQRLRNTTAALRQAMQSADAADNSGSVSNVAAGPGIASAPNVGPDGKTPPAPGGATDAAVTVRPEAGTGPGTLTSTGSLGNPDTTAAPASTGEALDTLGKSPTTENTGTSGSTAGSTAAGDRSGPSTTRRNP
jgi:hypothetical protein